MSTSDIIITREIALLPDRADNAHKGEVGRVTIIGGCSNDQIMIGAVALTANAALRSGAGLVQLMVPEAIANPVAVLTPCAVIRKLPTEAKQIIDAIETFGADVIALGPGLGHTLTPETVSELVTTLTKPIVIDADGLNLLASCPPQSIPNPLRIVMTPHPGEMKRWLSAIQSNVTLDHTSASRSKAINALQEALGTTVVLKGRGTMVTDGRRLFVNETGNSGMATGGTGDVLTGIIAALIGQHMDPFEASILGVFLHGLAGDFAAEELGRYALTAMDLIEYLPEAFGEHELSTTELGDS